MIGVICTGVMAIASIAIKRPVPQPTPMVLPAMTIAPATPLPTEPPVTPQILRTQAEKFYLQMKNKQFSGASEWFKLIKGTQTFITDQTIAEANVLMQFEIKEITVGNPEIVDTERAIIPLQVKSVSAFQKESTASLRLLAGRINGAWAFEPIGPVKVMEGVPAVKFSGIQKKSDNRVTGALAVPKIIFGVLPQSSRESVFGAWVFFDGKFTSRQIIKRVHFEEGENFYAADPYIEKKKDDSGVSNFVWDFIFLDPSQLLAAKSLSFKVTDLFSSPQFELGATPVEIDTAFVIEVPLKGD